MDIDSARFASVTATRNAWMSCKSPAALDQTSTGWKRSPSNVEYHRCITVASSRLTSCDLVWLPQAGQCLLVAGNDNQISIWQLSTGKVLWRYSSTSDGSRSVRLTSVQLKQSTVTGCRMISADAFCTTNADGGVQKWSLSMDSDERGGGGGGVWDAACVFSEEGHTAEVTSLSVYLGGSRILTTSKDFTCRVWDTASMKVELVFEGHECEVYGSAVEEDGQLAITSGQLEPERSSVLLWRPGSGELTHRLLGHTGWADVCAISGPAGLAAVAGVHGIVFVFDTATGRLRYSAKTGYGSRSSMRFSSCGLFILTGGYDLGELVLMESRYGQELIRVHTSQEPGKFNTTTGCFFLPDEPTATAAAGTAATAPASQCQTPQLSSTSQKHHHQSLKTLSGSSRGGVAFTDRYYDQDLDTGVIGRTSSNVSSTIGHGHHNPHMSAFGAALLGKSRGSAKVAPLEHSSGQAFPTRFGCVCSDGSIRLFDVMGDSYDEGIYKDERMRELYDADVSPDGKLFICIWHAGPFQEELHVYDFETAEFIWGIKVFQGTYGLYLLCSPDTGLSEAEGGEGGAAGTAASGPGRKLRGRVVTCGGDRHVRVIDLAERRLVRSIDAEHSQDTVSAQMNNAFTKMLTTCDGYDAWTSYWDIETGALIRKFDEVHSEGLYDALFTKDDKKCISVACDKTAAIFDLETGEVLQRFVGHEHWVRFAALSPDEKTLATASNDQTVRIWNVAKGNCLHVIRDHRGTVSYITWVHPTWIVSSARDGTIIGFNLQTATSVPLLVGEPIGTADGAEKVKPMPLSVSVAGPRFPPLLGYTLNGRFVVLNLSVRQPLPHQLLRELETGLWGLDHVAKLADTFPGLAVVPMAGGETLLHRAAQAGQVELLRVLINHSSRHGGIASAPLPANAAGKTPLDLALEVRNLQCVDLLLANEVARAPEHRLAAMKAWGQLAAEMPHVLVKFLTAVGIDEPMDAAGSSAMMVPVREGTSVITCGSKEYRVDLRLWEEVLARLRGDPVRPVGRSGGRAGGKGAGGEEAAAGDKEEDEEEEAPLQETGQERSGARAERGRRREAEAGPGVREWLRAPFSWLHRKLRKKQPPVLQPAVPGVCGLPYVATTCRARDKSPLAALVRYDVAEAFETDIGYAILTYKWDTYAGRIYRQQTLLYLLFMVLYVFATSLGVEWNPRVDRTEMYDVHGNGGSGGRAVARIVLEASVLLLDMRYLWEEVSQLKRHGWRQYFTGHNSVWNWVEFLSALMVVLVVVLQLLSVQAARWLMSLTTILLGTRLLKVASGSEGTGIFVQVIIRIIGDLRHYLLIVLVTLFTYALAFRQIMVYYIQASGEAPSSDDFASNFGDFPSSMLSVYYFMTVGGISTSMGGDASFVWYLHAMLISFTFLVSIILLNLLIAVMSDTYVVVKQHAKSEWLLLKARLVLDIDSNMPDSFFDDKQKSAPRWLHVVNVKRTSSPAHASLLDTIRGTVVRQALNTDLTETKRELKQHISDLSSQVDLLRREMAQFVERLAAAGPSPTGAAAAAAGLAAAAAVRQQGLDDLTAGAESSASRGGGGVPGGSRPGSASSGVLGKTAVP